MKRLQAISDAIVDGQSWEIKYLLYRYVQEGL